MRHFRLRQPVYALCVSALLLVLAAASGCGAPPASATATSVPVHGNAIPPNVIVRMASALVPSRAAHTQVTASCQTGEQLIGGGFSASGAFEYDVKIVASYPASATTWTVAIASSPAFILRAEAYCLPASITLGLVIGHASMIPSGHASMTPSGSVSCPPGTVLLSGGFQGDEVFSASRPDGNGWYATTFGFAGTVYDLCASQHVSAGGMVTAPFNPHSSAHNYYPAGASLACPAGQSAISGGFRSGGDLILTSASGGSPFQQWSVTAGGDGDMTLYARCVILTS